ncbi:hypothetical protein NS383_17660 [Pseudomonas oryzihabitans]|nr:hypothetical protein NS383_17660 [Pseudomonas psychrotolerans]
MGSAWALLRNPLEFLRSTHARHGDIYRIKAAHMEFVVMAGMEANRFVADKGKDCFVSSGFWEGTLREMQCPHSFIGVDGDPHRFQRNLMKPMFSKTAFNERIPMLAEIFMGTLQARYGEPQQVSALFRHVLSQQIGGSLQGYRPTPQEVEALMRYQTTAMNVCSLGKWPRLALKMPGYRAAKRQVQALADRIIASENAQEQGLGYFQTLREKGQQVQPQWFTQGDMRNHAIISYLAGIDTVGATLSFMLLELFRQPALHKLLREEVDDCFSAGVPDADGLENMETLRNFIREVMRLYPTAYAVRRTAARTFEFQGCTVEKGQDIILFTTANHTDPAWFKEPFRFDISRYQAPRLEHRVSGAWAPFGRGPHTCIGAGLANILLSLNLALFLRHTELQPACRVERIRMEFSNPTAGLDERFSIRFTPRILA